MASQIILRRQGLHSDVMGRYYTSNLVSEALVNAMACSRTETVLELASGQGALSVQAALHWDLNKLYTVDMDESAMSTLASCDKQIAHQHLTHDALDEKLADLLGIELASIDAGLCNPPYIRPRWKKSFGNILEDAGLSGALPTVKDAGADILFIAQNLRFLKDRGKLGLILPDGVIAGNRCAGVREELLRSHTVEEVIQLPRDVFQKTEAQTYLLVLSKHAGETQTVRLRSMDSVGRLSSAYAVDAEEAKIRLDYSYHYKTYRKKAERRNASQPSVIEAIFRGSLSTKDLFNFNEPVFHLCDFPKNVCNSRGRKVPRRFEIGRDRLRRAASNAKYAVAGDILVGRVGRNLQEKVCILERGACFISDCVFVLRLSESKRDTVFQWLVGPQGKAMLEAVAHGVGARYLTQADLERLIRHI